MSIQLVIAEKPSVARSIAGVIGADQKRDGYMEGNGYLVSWCIGHLVSLADAGAYDERFKKWRYDDLPILPQEWQYIIPAEKKGQFAVLRSLMERPDVTGLVCATDAGREGELIFRFVYQMAGCKKPFKRLWISSMEDAAIREGFAHLKPGADYDDLYQSALCRAQADWLVGINATRLFSILYHKTLTVGRVQTPTLNMLVDREAKISNFKKEKYHVVHIAAGGMEAANELGYPVLVRPSYVLGGQGMEIAYNDRNIEDFMKIINMTVQEHPILIDKYLMGRELEVDGVFDGEDILIPGIMEHVERAGVHSGDSIAVYPPINLEDKHRELILKHTKNMAKHLNVIGLINAQYILYNDDIYVIEVNPRSSRTIPYISKVTGVPIIDLATKVMLGQKLKDLGYGTGIYKEADYYAVKAPVFSFEKLTDVDTGLGPEMKSTGEVLGLAETYPQALLKAFKGCGLRVPKRGSRIIVTVKDEDKPEMIGIARGFEEMGIEIYATSGTCDALTAAGIACKRVNRVSQSHPNILDMIQSGTVDLIINTPTKGRKHDSDGFKIRRSAVEHSVACVTAIDTARAVLTVREQSRSEDLTPIDITKI